MTKYDLNKLATEAGIDCDIDGDIWGSTNGALLRFAELVAAHEREACAKVVEASPSYDWHRFACEAAAAIRARKENT